MRVRKRNFACRFAESFVPLVDFADESGLGASRAFEDEEAAVVEVVDDVHHDVLVGSSKCAFHVQFWLAGEVVEAFDRYANIGIGVFGDECGDALEVFFRVVGESLECARLEDFPYFLGVVVLEVDGFRLQRAFRGCVHGLEDAWAVGKHYDHVVVAGAAEHVQNLHGAIFGTHGVYLVQHHHGLSRVHVFEFGEQLIERCSADGNSENGGQGLEARVVVSHVTVNERDGLVCLEFLGDVPDHEGLAASPASKEGEVFGDAGVAVLEDGVDDDACFFAHEGLIWNVVEVEDGEVFDGAGLFAECFFAGL